MSSEKPDQYKSVHAPYILGPGREEVQIGGKPGELTSDQLHILIDLFTTHKTRFERSHAEIARSTLIPLRTVKRQMGQSWIEDVVVTGIDASGKRSTLVCKASRSKLAGQPGAWRRKPMRFEVSCTPDLANATPIHDLTSANLALAGPPPTDLASAKAARTSATVALSLEGKNYSSSSSFPSLLSGKESSASRARSFGEENRTPAEDDAWIDEEVPTSAKGEAPAEEQADNDPHAHKPGARFARKPGGPGHG